MLRQLEAGADIKAAQRQLLETLTKALPETAVRDIGYQGGPTPKARLRTDGTHWFYAQKLTSLDTPTPRFTNWFGQLTDGSSVDIDTEINVPLLGYDGRSAGFFAQDELTGQIALMHSGRIGGGVKGVGKIALLAWSGLAPLEVSLGGGKVREGMVVMPIAGTNAWLRGRRYIETIAAFKAAVRNGGLDIPAVQQAAQHWKDYYAEGHGRRQGRRNSVIDYLSRHGEIVAALKVWLETDIKVGDRLVKDRFIDLGMIRQGKLVELFEVKTNGARPTIYEAIGQLLCHATVDTRRRHLVIPANEAVAPALMAALDRMDIEVIRFKFEGEGVSFMRARPR